MLKRVIQTLIVVLGLVAFAFAGTPQMINYQGRLTDAEGNPVVNGNYSVTFTIYDAAVQGISVWTETQNATTTDGQFSVLLGSVNPILDTVFNNPDRYLGITVENDPELTPRSQLVSVSYSLRVSTIDGSTGGVISGDVSIQSDLTVSGEIGPASVRIVGPDGIKIIQPNCSVEIDAVGVPASSAQVMKLCRVQWSVSGLALIRLKCWPASPRRCSNAREKFRSAQKRSFGLGQT